MPACQRVCPFQFSMGPPDRDTGGNQETSPALPVQTFCQKSIQRAATPQTHEAWECKSTPHRPKRKMVFVWTFRGHSWLSFFLSPDKVIGLLDVFTAEISLDRLRDLQVLIHSWMQLIKVVVVTPGWLDSSFFTHSYLVMPFMGTDLGKLMKLERLTEDRVQFLVYQMLKGLKVTAVLPAPVKVARGGSYACSAEWSWSCWWRLCLLSPQYIHSAGIIHRVCELWLFRLWALGGGALVLFQIQSHSSRFPHTELTSHT